MKRLMFRTLASFTFIARFSFATILIMLLVIASFNIAITASVVAQVGVWREKQDMSTARYAMSAAVVDGNIYVVGGWNRWNKRFLKTVEMYNPRRDRWEPRADISQGNLGVGVAAVNGNIYAIGGWTGGTLLNTVEEYNPVADKWTRKANMPTARNWVSAAVVVKVMFRKLVALFLAMFCAVLGVHTFICADTLGDSADIQTVADWFISLQYTNPDLPSYGAIKIHHDPGLLGSDGKYYFRVVPYSANLSVVGLLRAPVEGKLEVAEKWMDWRLSHLNADGTVYDHWYLADGTGETTCPLGIDPALCNYADADDSSAATFLGVAWTYYEEGGSADFLNALGNKEKFETIAEVILALQQTDGLTWAKDSYHVKYLMDNSEVYWGLKSMARLEAEVYDDTVAAQTCEGAAEQVRNGIKTELFNPSAELYSVAKFEDGTFEEANLNVWYPGTVALVWPHLFGVTEAHSARAQAQMAALNDSWDGSPNPDWVTNIVDAAGFPWTSIGHAALLAGDQDRARGHAEFVKRLKFPTFDWPFTVDDAGWLLMTLSAPLRKGPPLKFRDNFETDKEWGIFEEIVGGSECYEDEIGEVARTTDVALDGSYSLRIWANKKGTTKSNHVIAQKRLSYSGHTGRWRYELYVYIDPETGNTGQTGPEFSMQNTRKVDDKFLTSTAGIQYWANPYDRPGSWAVWREDTLGHASWQIFTTQLLTPGEWYYIAVEADYTTNKYGRFWLRGPGVNLKINLSGYSIAQEDKGWDQEAFWITLESENLWNNCGTAGVFDYKVYYDDVKLQPRGQGQGRPR